MHYRVAGIFPLCSTPDASGALQLFLCVCVGGGGGLPLLAILPTVCRGQVLFISGLYVSYVVVLFYSSMAVEW